MPAKKNRAKRKVYKKLDITESVMLHMFQDTDKTIVPRNIDMHDGASDSESSSLSSDPEVTDGQGLAKFKSIGHKIVQINSCLPLLDKMSKAIDNLDDVVDTIIEEKPQDQPESASSVKAPQAQENTREGFELFYMNAGVKFTQLSELLPSLSDQITKYNRTIAAEIERLEKSAEEMNKAVELEFKLGTTKHSSAVEKEDIPYKMVITNKHLLQLKQNYSSEAARYMANLKKPLADARKRLAHYEDTLTKLQKLEKAKKKKIAKKNIKYATLLEDHRTMLINDIDYLERKLNTARTLLLRAQTMCDKDVMQIENVKTELALLETEKLKRLEGMMQEDAKLKEAQNEVKTLNKHLNDLRVASQAKEARIDQLNNQIRVNKQESDLAKKEIDELRKSYDKIRKNQDKRHSDYQRQYKNQTKAMRDDYNDYIKYFGKAMNQMRREGLTQLRTDVKYHDRMVKAITKTALQEGKINKKLSDGLKLWSLITIIKLSSLIVVTDAVLAGIEFGIYCGITKPETIQDAFALSVPLLVVIIISAIVLDIIIIATYVVTTTYFHKSMSQPITIVNEPNPLEAPKQLQEPVEEANIEQPELQTDEVKHD